MSAEYRSDLHEFHQFVAEKAGAGEVALSPEDILDEWRELHPTPDALESDLAAIQEAIHDMDNGDAGIPFEEFDRDFRTRRNLSARS